MSTWLGNWTWISFTLSWYSYLTRKLEMVLHFWAASGYIYSISLESSLLAGCVLTLYDSIQLWRKWPLQQLVKGLQDWHQGYDWKVSKPMSFMCLLGALATCNWLCRRTPNQCGGCLFLLSPCHGDLLGSRTLFVFLSSCWMQGRWDAAQSLCNHESG